MRLVDIVIFPMTEEYQEQVRRYFLWLLSDNDDSNDDTHDMGVGMCEHGMWVYPMTMMVTHTMRCSSSVLYRDVAPRRN
jgi:hypothetical protein